MDRLRRLFARNDDPYAGGDIDNARRIGSILWLLAVVLVVALMPLSPPTESMGAAGWIPAAGVVAAGLLIAFALRGERLAWSWNKLLAVGYLGLAGLALMQWLSGGVGSPYDTLFMLPVLFVAAISPPRRIAVFMGAVALALAAPVIYDSGNSDAAAAAGAQFVIWGALAAIGAALMGGIRAQRLALREEGDAAREEARVDRLTQLGNRLAFDEAMEVEISRAQRLRLPLSLVLVDIERFKEINDRWGHLEGDATLRQVSSTLRGELRRPDLCFRWGGDEFVLLLSGTGADGAAKLAERLARIVAIKCPRPDAEPVLLRYGVSVWQEGMAASELVEMADLALIGQKIEHASRPDA